MWKCPLAVTSLFCLLLAQPAAAQLTLTGAGKTGSSSGSYIGPGDLQSFTAWGGFRAYRGGTRGSPAINVCNVSDVACVDMVTDLSTGALVVTTVGGVSCSSVTCTIKTIYDQTGNGHDVTQATIANRLTLTVSCVNTLPCGVAAGSVIMKSAAFTVAQTFSVSTVAIRTTFTTYQPIVTENSGTMSLYFSTTANKILLYAGSLSANVSANDNAWHNIQAVYNNAASIVNVDTTITGSLNANTNSFAGGILLGQDNTGTFHLIGDMAEYGILAATLSTVDSQALDANQHAFWGTGL